MNLRHSILGVFPILFTILASPAGAFDVVEVLPPKTYPQARQPQVAVSPTGQVFLVFGEGNSIYCTSARNSLAFDRPVKVADVGALALGMRRGPRVAATDKAVMVTAIGGLKGRGTDEDLLAWRSSDSGRTWQGPVRLNSVSGSAREGLHHLAAGKDGQLYCVWLDLRGGRSQVFSISSSDGGASWGNDQLVYESPAGSVCECCQPQVAFDPANGLHVMWRNQLSGNRDMFLASSTDLGKTFGPAKKLGQGTWPLKSCPMDGGGLAGGLDGSVTTIWRRQKENFICMPGKPEKSLGKGEQGWAVTGPGGTYLVWIAGRPGPVWTLLPGKDQPVELARSGQDPVVAASPDGRGPVVAAWEEGPSNRKTIRASILADAKPKN